MYKLFDRLIHTCVFRSPKNYCLAPTFVILYILYYFFFILFCKNLLFRRKNLHVKSSNCNDPCQSCSKVSICFICARKLSHVCKPSLKPSYIVSLMSNISTTKCIIIYNSTNLKIAVALSSHNLLCSSPFIEINANSKISNRPI